MERTFLARFVPQLLGVACPVVVDRCSLPARFAVRLDVCLARVVREPLDSLDAGCYFDEPLLGKVYV